MRPVPPFSVLEAIGPCYVIWCIEEGELDKITPKVVVLMIGTNNTDNDSAKDIANRKIISMIQDKRPDTILLLAVFPRGPRSMRGGVADPWRRAWIKSEPSTPT